MYAERTKPDRPWLTVAQAAEALGIAPATVRRAIDSGRLRGYRLGSTRRVFRSDLERLIDTGETLS